MVGWSFALYPDAAEGGGSFRSVANPSPRGRSLDPIDSRDDAARRARGKVRRYCAANRLNRLGTLTYRGDGCHDPAALREDVGGFFRRLRGSVGERFPYLWVPEWHKGGHGLHVHFAVGRFVGVRVIDGSGTLGEARLASRYLSKYVGKDLGEGEAAGLHRYEVAQGFQPRRLSLDGPTADDVLGWADSVMDRPAGYLWRSRDQADWTGPPAVWASWD